MNANGRTGRDPKMYDWQGFSRRLRELCEEYCDVEHPDPPIEGITDSRFNSLISGVRKPSPEELLIISDGFDVSINYLLTGDKLFPSLHGLKKKDSRRILDEIAAAQE